MQIELQTASVLIQNNALQNFNKFCCGVFFFFLAGKNLNQIVWHQEQRGDFQSKMMNKKVKVLPLNT